MEDLLDDSPQSDEKNIKKAPSSDTDPQADSEAPTALQPKPARIMGLVVPGVILVVIIITAVIFISLHKKPSDETRETTVLNTPTPIPTTSITEGKLKIKEGERVMFPSGAVLQIGNPKRGSELIMSYNKDTPREDKLYFGHKITAYINGYMHVIDKAHCSIESRFFEDYFAPVISECSMEVSVAPQASPILPSYDRLSIDFNSVSSKSIPRFQTLQEEPWIAVWVPYFQIYKRADGSVVNVVSPREDVVNIYTNYGRSGFKFSADDLNQRVEKTKSAGPLKLRLTPQKLKCSQPYVGTDGSCYNPDGKGATYNVTEFRLTISEGDGKKDIPLLLDIEKR